MSSIKERYKPYNFSSTKCYVIRLPFRGVRGFGRFGIEHKLPFYIGKLKGIYITCRSNSSLYYVGSVFLSFNEGLFKNFQYPIINTTLLRDRSHPIPLEEEIFSNSLLQGYYTLNPSGTDSGLIGYLSIYLHYEEREKRCELEKQK